MVFDIDDEPLPKWARWKAQDADGTWWVYEIEPLQFHKGWYENEVGQNQHLGLENTPLDWENSLKRVNNA